MITIDSNKLETSNNIRNHMPWVEKYRPKKISDVSCQNEVIQALKSSVDSGRLPHLLFYGPPGSGKTSTILAFCHELYGEDMKDRVLEMNASDERGIAVIREKIKTFAQRSVSSKNANIPPFKIIILDECDNMTSDAQSALRRIIENYTKVTRFCLICNYISRIIPPLASRCAKFRYKLLSSSSMIDRLKYIASEENITIPSEDIFMTLYNISNGDMRKSIQILQNAYLLYGNNINNNEIYEMAGKVPKERINEIFIALKSFIFDNINGLVQDGYSASTIINEFFECLRTSELFDDKQRSDICLAIAHSDFALSKGADEYLQLMSIMSVAIQVLLGEL